MTLNTLLILGMIIGFIWVCYKEYKIYRIRNVKSILKQIIINIPAELKEQFDREIYEEWIQENYLDLDKKTNKKLLKSKNIFNVFTQCYGWIYGNKKMKNKIDQMIKHGEF